MKKTLLFSVALAGLMLGSCSSSDDLNGGGTNTGSNQSGKGYVAFNINLPSQSGTSSRAGSENDQFNEGMTSEYDVKDGALLLFNGSTEKEATFMKAYPLSTAPWTHVGDNTNVTTTSATIVKEVDSPASGNVYALVVLNRNNAFSLDPDGNIEIGSAKFDGSYADFMKKSSSASMTNYGFYMANAPLASLPGGTDDPAGATITTLVNLKDKIKETESAAKSAPAQIYVERGVAKVTMQPSTTATVVPGSKPKGSTTEVAFLMTDWCLDNTNKSTYLVRSTEDFDKWVSLHSNSTSVSPAQYRFVGSNKVAEGLYRTYFAKDANYTKTENETAVTAHDLVTTTTPTFVNKFGDKNPQYCFENTFDVESQKDEYTTRVLIKAQLNGGKDFYVINGDENTIFTENDVIAEIQNQFLSEYATWIETNVELPTTVNQSNVKVTISTDAGDVSIKSITIDGLKLKATASAAGLTGLPSDVVTKVTARLGSIKKYDKGDSYYFVRIKHFGDDLTPWKNGESPAPSSTAVYGSPVSEANYLGRYGVLRNNWYDISVTGVQGLGSATVPEVTTTTDDELKSYIAVQINVLSWAKRTQGAVLH